MKWFIMILHDWTIGITPRFLRDIAREELARPFDWYCTATLTAEIVLMSFWSSLYSEFTLGWFAHLIAGVISGTIIYIITRTLGRWVVEKLEDKIPFLKRKADERKP
jgi:ABC-type Fe3+-siderophore transport system permease subunit